MKNILQDFPDTDELMQWRESNPEKRIHAVNGHIHTPYSFSSFIETEQAFQMATEENIKVLGINDFYTTAGYDEFNKLSLKYSIFPLFNIEFMGLLKDKQDKVMRINDPNNPGRIYLSGKGLDFPVKVNGDVVDRLKKVINESQRQTQEMLEKASDHLISLDPRLSLDYAEALRKYTRGMLRERHIARAIRIKVFDINKTSEERQEFLMRLYGGKASSVDMNNHAALENEIRSELLKSGGKAFVKESPEAFLELTEVIGIIHELGGIPCYPVLLDDPKGNITEFEQNYDALYHELTAKNIFCIELIPGRNDFLKLKEFVNYFHSKQFVITFGTEHNTPDLMPLTVGARNGIPLDDELKRVSYEGACVIAAHQYLRATGKEGYIGLDTIAVKQKDKFIQTGDAVIEYFIRTSF